MPPRAGGLEWPEAEEGTPGAEASPGPAALTTLAHGQWPSLPTLQGWQP